MSNSYKRTKKLRKHLHDKMVEYWSDDKNIRKQQRRLRKRYKELGKDTGIKAKQQLRGVRDEEGYREYQFEYQRQYRERKPKYYCWRQHVIKGYTNLDYDEWYVIYSKNPKYYKET